MITAALLLAAAALIATGRAAGRLDRVPIAGPPPMPRGRRMTDPLALASALDVFAVCLSAGMTVSAAARVTAASAPPPLDAVLRRAADLLALGADVDTAWSSTTDDQTCQTLLRLARRSANSGTALAENVAELAEKTRRDLANGAVAAGERAGVLIAGPLGVCFLPAFICLGVVPVVAGLAGHVFGQGLL